MKPSQRIREIFNKYNLERGEPKNEYQILARGINCIQDYLDEQWEDEQKGIEQLQKDIKPM